jgi:hypothetical protein
MNSSDPGMYFSEDDKWMFSADYYYREPHVQEHYYEPQEDVRMSKKLEKPLIVAGLVGLAFYVLNHSYVFF